MWSGGKLLLGGAVVATMYLGYVTQKDRIEEYLLSRNGVDARGRIQQVVDLSKKAMILVVDIGSSSIRCSAYFLNENNNTWSMVPYSLNQRIATALNPLDGSADIKQIQVDVEYCVDATLHFLQLHDVENVVAIGFSAFAMSLLGVDQQGIPVTPVYTYAGKCASEAKELSKLLQNMGITQEVSR